jgi:hypothetical protein
LTRIFKEILKAGFSLIKQHFWHGFLGRFKRQDFGIWILNNIFNTDFLGDLKGRILDFGFWILIKP